MNRRVLSRDIFFILPLAFAFTFLSGCAKSGEPGVWANGFSEKTAGFQKISVFLDFTVLRKDDQGKTFIALRESLADAPELDRTLVEILEKKGYGIGTHERFFVGTYATQNMHVANAEGKSGPLRAPPFHVDPEIERIKQHRKDLLAAFRMLAQMPAMTESKIKKAFLPPDISRRIAGNYRSSGFLLALGLARRIPGDPKNTLPLTKDRIGGMREPFFAVGYFEGMTGRLVFLRKVQFRGRQDSAFFRKILRKFHSEFPKARTAGRFQVPPRPKFETEKKTPAGPPFFASPDEILPGLHSINRMGILRGKGGIPFTKTPSADRLGTRLLSSETPVRIIGSRNVYTKIVLENGDIGWVPTSAVWIKK